MTAPALSRISAGSSSETVAAEIVILELCRVLLGDPQDKGLMPRMVQGERHLKMCAIGQYLEAGDSLRGGQPCSDRCQRVHDAIDMAGIWLKAHEAETSQPTLFDEQEAV